MPIYYDITQDDLYKEGLETGIQQERKRAEQERKRAEQDRKRAERERRNTVIALLQLGILTDEQIAKITNITMEKLNSIKQNLD